MTEAERISLIITHLEGGNIAEFGRSIGVSKAQAWKMQNGHTGIRLRVDNILKAYPQVNRTWLETGEGYPGDLSIDLVKTRYEKKIEQNERIIDSLIKRIEQLEKQAEIFSVIAK